MSRSDPGREGRGPRNGAHREGYSVAEIMQRASQRENEPRISHNRNVSRGPAPREDYNLHTREMATVREPVRTRPQQGFNPDPRTSGAYRNVQQHPTRPRTPVPPQHPPVAKRETKKKRGFSFYFMALMQDLVVIPTILVGSFLGYLFVYKPYDNEQQRIADNQEFSREVSSHEVIPNEDKGAAGFINKPNDGQLFGQIVIPALGSDWKYSITAGTSLENIKYGPGWYENTQLPGEKGNFAIAGHNGVGGAFTHIHELETCDDINVITAGGTWNYKVPPKNNTEAEWNKFRQCAPFAAETLDRELYKDLKGQSIVSPFAIEVTNPVPMSKSVYIPNNASPVITLQSCWPPNGNSERVIVHGVLESSERTE